MICPDCGCSAYIKYGINKQNKQVYQCKRCGKRYIYKKKIFRPSCIYCNNPKTRLNGKNTAGVRVYICSVCKKVFHLGETKRKKRLSLPEKKLVFYYYKVKRMKRIEIAEKLGVSRQTVTRIIESSNGVDISGYSLYSSDEP